jgi:predicted phage terminase large subunit-like protein
MTQQLPKSIASSLRSIPVDTLKAALAKRSLKDFIMQTWHLVEPSVELSWNWHHDVLCDLLESVTRGELKRVVINIPPGCSKSLIVSTFWPAFEWASDASYRYFTASYSEANTIRDNRRLRSIVTSDWYQKHFNVELSSDQYAKVRFDTTVKGWRIASSVGGTGTGEHPDRIIIDDPLKAEDARSTTKLEECKEWYKRTIASRQASKRVATILIMQRLHMDDLSQYLLDSEVEWHHLCLPMRYVSEPIRVGDDVYRNPDSRDKRTIEGELLWPAIWDEEKVRVEEIDLGPFGASAQLQQNPVPEGGGLFKEEWFQYVDAAPVIADKRVRGWDTAATEDSGDWTVGVRMSEVDNIIYVEDVCRGQWGPATVDKMMKAKAIADGKECGIREEREGGGSGKAITTYRARQLKGYDYAEVIVSKDKVTRANPFRAQCQAGNVRLVRGAWNSAYLSVMTSFPVGKYDDDVDASSCAYNSIVGDVADKVQTRVTRPRNKQKGSRGSMSQRELRRRLKRKMKGKGR